MLNVRGSEDVRLLVRGGGGEEEEEPLLALRLPGGVKGVKGPWELDARRCSAELDVTGDWNGVWGGTRLGSLLFLLFEVRLEEVEALAEELCVPGAVKGDGSKGRCDDDDDDDWLLPPEEEEAAWGGPSSLEMNSTFGPFLSHDVAYPRSLLLAKLLDALPGLVVRCLLREEDDDDDDDDALDPPP
mmetsp:Transcript_33095/g.71524  ORF Transcript_33095/g.71524 Transcript_33095/m.71524 type:complete len:186 (+) Transcript_33095:1685-2242(+)